MIRLVTRGRFSHAYVKALLGAPEDREPAVRKLIEGAHLTWTFANHCAVRGIPYSTQWPKNLG